MKNINKQLFHIEIRFINNFKFNFWKSHIEFYLKEEFKWVSLEQDSLVSFENILIKITDTTSKQISYIFLENCNMIILNNKVFINSLNLKNIYQESKKTKFDDENIKKINEKLTDIKWNSKLKTKLDDLIVKSQLITNKYKQELINEFKLIEKEWNEN
ncbi:MSC_0621 family F1-like ATPase epsilon subunit [Mesomycoplasma lagogenitalium]|uniref:Uncharacterized protein n=1 Tax=Mesomycoplasma lagogenitalium TaxID=171286 RepID=A0ABY8LUV4_9BACT|nr:hypothetical protein [Mesomycoplasma lagogenitalium]WGI37004.1 hypothetical protein QEG99_01820 [Mesomycoplasma lagogenitalium]